MKISFIGAGAIAEALLIGLLAHEDVKSKDIAFINKSNQHRLQYLTERYQLPDIAEQKAMLLSADVIILAVKPQVANETLAEWGPKFRRGQQIISVIAGIPTSHIESFFNEEISVIRSMPNTSSTIGMSATAITAGKYASNEDMKRAEKIFQGVGTVVVLEEHLMDAVTGLSGSGPAYFYLMVEGLELAAQKVGLPRNVSRQLILQTLIGASHMLMETEKKPEVLRQEITSEGGTTAAGLQVMKEYKFIEGLEKTIEAATKRSKEMGEAVCMK
ncbi:pyrroline-5-carboxylate reductase [Shimazuella sp. AN120528]|uniref:pyrroline-5-carboxylate reductase n=1 Tax=Shimazuella soli TaxID=1892854 RepID=UPI001F0DFDEC|nr:pyrroline-5-carboxylate reductase [Shimazuella soli]MCH5586584.1 pyrroline-5-carboxylate reductase [Shimazuella soli]